MTPEQEIYQRCIADAGLSATIGNRMFPGLAPQSARYPMAVYQRISRTSADAIDDASGVATARLQIDVYGDTYTATDAAKRAMRLCLNGWNGTTGPVRAVRLVNELQGYDGDDAARLHRHTLDFLVTYIDD